MTPTKSLEDVTKDIAQMALSGTASYDPFTLLMDAHHYLAEYLEKQAELATKQKNFEDELDRIVAESNRLHEAKLQYITAHADLYAEEPNDPLSWDDLQKMVGKPVWIECYPEGHKSSARWYVIREIGSKDRENLMYCHGAFHFTKDAQGKIWNAYLKERTNVNEA